MNLKLQEVCAYLPAECRAAVFRVASLYGESISEIRMRRDRYLSLTVNSANVETLFLCTQKMMEETVMSLCRQSVYAFTETIKEGYLTAERGLRVGICGKAVVTDGRIVNVAEITSLCFRIPQSMPGAADFVAALFQKHHCREGILIYSPPGVGKTTVLRELIRTLKDKRVAVVDTRYELVTESSPAMMTDVLAGYPRAKGIEIALRTLSPEVIVCDEIGSEDDAVAIAGGIASGVPIIASAHGDSLETLVQRPMLKRILDTGAFPITVGLLGREGSGYRVEIHEETPCFSTSE